LLLKTLCILQNAAVCRQQWMKTTLLRILHLFIITV